jgi:hypothetical protein
MKRPPTHSRSHALKILQPYASIGLPKEELALLDALAMIDSNKRLPRGAFRGRMETLCIKNAHSIIVRAAALVRIAAKTPLTSERGARKKAARFTELASELNSVAGRLWRS